MAGAAQRLWLRYDSFESPPSLVMLIVKLTWDGYCQLFMTAVSPWQWYCSTRSFSNSLETTLTVMALYHWPWSAFDDSEALARNIHRTGSHALRSVHLAKHMPS